MLFSVTSVPLIALRWHAALRHNANRRKGLRAVSGPTCGIISEPAFLRSAAGRLRGEQLQ